jgi:hypothetical protein
MYFVVLPQYQFFEQYQCNSIGFDLDNTNTNTNTNTKLNFFQINTNTEIKIYWRGVITRINQTIEQVYSDFNQL